MRSFLGFVLSVWGYSVERSALRGCTRGNGVVSGICVKVGIAETLTARNFRSITLVGAAASVVAVRAVKLLRRAAACGGGNGTCAARVSTLRSVSWHFCRRRKIAREVRICTRRREAYDELSGTTNALSRVYRAPVCYAVYVLQAVRPILPGTPLTKKKKKAPRTTPSFSSSERRTEQIILERRIFTRDGKK